MSKKKVNRRYKFGMVSTVTAVLVTAVIVLINVVFSVLTDRYNWVPDFTKGNMYEISKESIEYLKTVDKKVEIFVLMDEKFLSQNKEFDSYLPQAAEIIGEYERYSPNITLKYVDLVKDPTFRQQYSDLNLQQSQILIKSGARTRVMEVSDLFNFDDYGIISSKAEEVMTTAIMGVTADKSVQVSVLTGFDTEADLYEITNQLTKNNYEVVEQNILTDTIDENSDIVILAGMIGDLSGDDVSRLETFLDNDGKLGKTLFYMSSSDMNATPNTDAFLKNWGIAVESELVYETDSSKVLSFDSSFYFKGDVLQSIFTENHDFSGDNFGVGMSRPVTLIFENSGKKSTYPLISASDTAVAIDFESFGAVDEDDVKERSGPFALVAMGMKSDSADNETKASYVIVSGSVDTWSSIFFLGNRYSNAEYFISTFNRIYEFDSGIVIAPKNFEFTQIDITVTSALVYGFIFIVVVPVILIIVGVTILIRRRRR